MINNFQFGKLFKEVLLIICIPCIFALTFNELRPNGIPLFNFMEFQEQIKIREIGKANVVGHEQILNALSNENIHFLDVRMPEEYNKGHIPHAINIPEDEIELKIGIIDSLFDISDYVIIYCDGEDCDSSLNAFKTLKEMGKSGMKIYLGGYQEWSKMKFRSSEDLE